VHRHFAAGDDGLAHAAAVAQSGQAEQVVERDELAVEREVDAVHARPPVAARAGRLASQRSSALPKAWRSRAWKPAGPPVSTPDPRSSSMKLRIDRRWAM